MYSEGIRLSAEESAELGRLAAALAGTEPGLVDHGDWLAAARELSCLVPARVAGAVREFRHDPGPDGVLLLRGLPVVESRPTPTVPESVERGATPVAAVMALVNLQLGELIAFREEKAGALVQNVVPVPGRERVQSNAGSAPLEMHTENAFHPYRPDYVALLCLRNDHENRAGLRTASVRRAAGLLSEETRKILSQERFVTEPPPSFGGLKGRAPVHALLTGAVDDPDVRVDFASTHPLEEEAEQAMAELGKAFRAVTRTTVLSPGDLAVLDNRVAIHGRTAFTPRYDGRDRWLHRCFVHLDHRRSRELRPAGGHVLA